MSAPGSLWKFLRRKPEVRPGYCPYHPSSIKHKLIGCGVCWLEDPR